MTRVPIEHLYFHIPFCPKLCPYCSFYVEVGSKNKTTAFLDALLKEVETAAAARALQPRTIYFGGGTPSALTTAQLAYLFDGLRARLDLSELVEWTLEANPATIREEKARLLRAAGVNRLSVGVQSWVDALLRTLGRTHSAAQAEETCLLLRETGFTNLNIDLMFSVPGQTVAQWEATLAKTIALRPEHISCYCLTYEEDTEYFRKLLGGAFKQDDERDADLFELTMETLTRAGYAQYEISNYASPGFASRHNSAYWEGRDFLGFGPSAFSTVGLHRWQNVCDTAAYVQRTLTGETTIGFSERLTSETRAGEIAAFGMRTAQGVALSDLERWPEAINQFRELGFLEQRGNRAVLTRRGKMMADTVAETFV